MQGDRIEERFRVFNRTCHLIVENGDEQGREHLEAAKSELYRLEEKFCINSPDSIIFHINDRAGSGRVTPLDAEARGLFTFAGALWAESKHQFDPTTHILQDYHQPPSRPGRPPLRDQLPLLGWSKLALDAQGALLPEQGMAIYLDNCIRPYAVDSAIKALLQRGVTSALIELDHDAATIGKQPDGANWLIGVKQPHGGRTAIKRIKLNNKGLAIRGNFEQCLTIDGERFGRSFSPVDGFPIPGLLSVSVLADSCLAASGAANVAQVKTEISALKWLQSLDLTWMAIDRELQIHGLL